MNLPKSESYVSLILCYLLYLPISAARWKNALFLGIDACFKLKLKDCGFNDPDLCLGSAYTVNEGPFQKYLKANTNVAETVSFRDFFHRSTVSTANHYNIGLHLWSRLSCCKPSAHKVQ